MTRNNPSLWRRTFTLFEPSICAPRLILALPALAAQPRFLAATSAQSMPKMNRREPSFGSNLQGLCSRFGVWRGVALATFCFTFLALIFSTVLPLFFTVLLPPRGCRCTERERQESITSRTPVGPRLGVFHYRKSVVMARLALFLAAQFEGGNGIP